MAQFDKGIAILNHIELTEEEAEEVSWTQDTLGVRWDPTKNDLIYDIEILKIDLDFMKFLLNRSQGFPLDKRVIDLKGKLGL
jgi:hypothetical protein